MNNGPCEDDQAGKDHFKTGLVWYSDDQCLIIDQTCLDHFKTGQVQYSDDQCSILFVSGVLSPLVVLTVVSGIIFARFPTVKCISKG